MTFVFLLLTLLALGLGTYLSLQFQPEVRDSNGRRTQEAGFKGVKFTPKSIGAFGLAALFFTGALSAVTVQAGSRGILKRFGRVAGNLEPGLHFVRPIGDSVTSFPVQSRIVKPNEDAASKDLQIVHFEVTFRYHIEAESADYIFQQYNGEPETRIIDPAILEAIKSVTSQYDVQELVSKRPLVRDGIEAFVTKTLTGTHIVPESVAITEFSFSKDYENAIEAKQVSQQKAEQAKNDLQRIEVEAQQVAAEAKGKSDAVIAEAQGDAQATLVNAKAKAEAQRLLKQDLTPELLKLRTIEKWDGSVPYLMNGGGSGNAPFSMLFQPPTERPTKKGDKQDDQVAPAN